MTTVGAHDSEHGAGPLLESRYRLATTVPVDHGTPVLVHGFDEVSDQAVTLLLLPTSSSMLERLALRSQARRFAELDHPAVATVLDVVDTRESLAVVLPPEPEARLLADGGALPADGVAQLRSALQALHALGRAHGALDEHAVLVLPGSTVQLLPLPPEPAAYPEEDLRALDALAARAGSGQPPGVPPQRGAQPLPAPGAQPATEVRSPAGATRLTRPARPISPSWASRGRRAAIVLAGACGGALLADLVSRLVT